MRFDLEFHKKFLILCSGTVTMDYTGSSRYAFIRIRRVARTNPADSTCHRLGEKKGRLGIWFADSSLEWVALHLVLVLVCYS